MARISDEFLSALSSRVEIEDVVSPYVSLRRRGRTLTGLCPFHNEKTPSFTIYPDNNSFYCFGCGAGGDVVSFVRRIENLDYVEAVKSLAARVGMALPDDGFDDSLSRQRTRILAANREAARFYHATLMSESGIAGQSYLSGRALTAETVKHFGLGFAPDSWDSLRRHMNAAGFSDEELFEADLLKKSSKNGRNSYYDNFRAKVIFPIIDLRGNVIGFGGRVLDNSKPKYINTSDTLVYKKSKAIFGLNFAKNEAQGKLILAEGYMDTIALHQAGFKNAVACLGTALTNEQASLLARYAGEVILAYDADGAGQKAAQRAMEILPKTGVKLRVLNLSGGKDPDEIIREYGRERFQSLLDGAANDTEFKLIAAAKGVDLETSDGKLHYLRAAVEVLASIDSAIERDIYASRLANELSVSKDAILLQIKDKARARNAGREKDRLHTISRETSGIGDKVNPERAANLKAAKAEETLIAALVKNPEFFQKLRTRVSPDSFITQFNKNLFSIIYKRLEQGKGVDQTLLSAELTVTEAERLASLLIPEKNLGNTVAECDDCINVLIAEKNKHADIIASELSDEDFRKLFLSN